MQKRADYEKRLDTVVVIYFANYGTLVISLVWHFTEEVKQLTPANIMKASSDGIHATSDGL